LLRVRHSLLHGGTSLRRTLIHYLAAPGLDRLAFSERIGLPERLLYDLVSRGVDRAWAAPRTMGTVSDKTSRLYVTTGRIRWFCSVVDRHSQAARSNRGSNPTGPAVSRSCGITRCWAT